MNLFTTMRNAKASPFLATGPEESETGRHGSDRVLLLSFILLMVLGMVSVYSAVAYFAQSKGVTAGSLFGNHVTKLVMGFVVMLIASKINYRITVRWSKVGLVASWLLLVIVSAFGESVFGARRSISLGGLSFQPSSLAFLSLILYVSGLLADKQEYIRDASRSFLPILFWVGTTCMLIAIEDFSTAAVLFLVCLTLMTVGRIPLLQIGSIVLLGAVGGTALLTSSQERMSRIEEYVDQMVNIRSTELVGGEGYQSQQAMIAIAQGGLSGVGIGKSTQRDFLPAPYNDFLFAIIAEEYGMLGAMTVLGLFTMILVRGAWTVARGAVDEVGVLAAFACTLMIAVYGFVHAGVSTGLLPVTGLPLPFMSYGGSSIMFTGMAAGVLLNISKHSGRTDKTFYMG